MTGHHMKNAVKKTTRWTKKCVGSEDTEAFTIVGQWVTTITRLNASKPNKGLVITRATFQAHAGSSIFRNSHVGIPINNRGGATSVNNVCCTMCMLNR